MRRRADSHGLPDCLARYDWREWRPQPEPDDPAPWYSAWYLGLFDWRTARRNWAAERGLSERQLPERVGPPTADLMGPVFAAAELEPSRPNHVRTVPKSRQIKL